MNRAGQDARPAEESDLILADIAHFEEKFSKNEEVGERRLEHFVTLITAAAAGLVALHTDKLNFDGGLLGPVRSGVLLALATLGVTTYFRMLQRNKVTDEYKATTDYLRRRYAKLHGATDYSVPVGLLPRWHEFFKGGLADTAAVVTAVLFTAMLLSIGQEYQTSRASQSHMYWIPAIGAGALALGLMIWGARRARNGPTARTQVFRANVGAVICDSSGHVLAFERRNICGAWQLPQGGLEEGEAPEEAVKREIQEETGIPRGAFSIISQHPELLAYELPSDLRSAKTGRGQVQYWFYLQATAEPKLPRCGEFQNWRRMELRELAETTVAFRQRVYAKLAEHLASEIQPQLVKQSSDPSAG